MRQRVRAVRVKNERIIKGLCMAIITPTDFLEISNFEPCSAQWDFSGVNQGITVSFWLYGSVNRLGFSSYYRFLDSASNSNASFLQADYRLFENDPDYHNTNVAFRNYKASFSVGKNSSWDHIVYSLGRIGTRYIGDLFKNGVKCLETSFIPFNSSFSAQPVLYNRVGGLSWPPPRRLAQLAIWKVEDLEVTETNIESFYSATNGMVNFAADGTVLGKRPLYYFTDNLHDNKGSRSGWPKNNTCRTIDYPAPTGLIKIKRAV